MASLGRSKYRSLSAYVIESYGMYAASAMAAVSTLRSLAAFGFPLFAPALMRNLGWEWGNTLLAGILLTIEIVAPLVLWKLGKGFRKNIKKSWRCHRDFPDDYSVSVLGNCTRTSIFEY